MGFIIVLKQEKEKSMNDCKHRKKEVIKSCDCDYYEALEEFQYEEDRPVKGESATMHWECKIHGEKTKVLIGK